MLNKLKKIKWWKAFGYIALAAYTILFAYACSVGKLAAALFLLIPCAALLFVLA